MYIKLQNSGLNKNTNFKYGLLKASHMRCFFIDIKSEEVESRIKGIKAKTEGYIKGLKNV